MITVFMFMHTAPGGRVIAKGAVETILGFLTDIGVAP